MKLTVVLANNHGARMDMIHAGLKTAVKKRTVDINLTEEQIKQIGIKKVGSDCGVDRFEEIQDCWIDPEVKP